MIKQMDKIDATTLASILSLHESPIKKWTMKIGNITMEPEIIRIARHREKEGGGYYKHIHIWAFVGDEPGIRSFIFNEYHDSCMEVTNRNGDEERELEKLISVGDAVGIAVCMFERFGYDDMGTVMIRSLYNKES